MSSPISGGGPIQPMQTNPVLKGGEKLSGPIAHSIANQINDYLNQTPPDFKSMLAYIQDNANFIQTKVPVDELDFYMNNIQNYLQNPTALNETAANQAANELVGLLSK